MAVWTADGKSDVYRRDSVDQAQGRLRGTNVRAASERCGGWPDFRGPGASRHADKRNGFSRSRRYRGSHGLPPLVFATAPDTRDFLGFGKNGGSIVGIPCRIALVASGKRHAMSGRIAHRNRNAVISQNKIRMRDCLSEPAKRPHGTVEGAICQNSGRWLRIKAAGLSGPPLDDCVRHARPQRRIGSP